MMSVIAAELFEPVLKSAVDLCWRQWSSVASGAVAEQDARTIIDPEALVVASLALSDREPRLGELAQRFMLSLSGVLSVGRMRRLLNDTTRETATRFGYVASLAAHQGGDARWRKLASSAAPQLPAWFDLRSKMQPRFARPAALVYRLRMGLGVGIKADTLALLIGTGEWKSVREVADATAWNRSAARRALDDLTLAGFIESSEPADWHPARARHYRAVASRWREVAKLGEYPAEWGYHLERFTFIIRIHDWLGEPNASQRWDELQLGYWAKEWMAKHSAAFRFGELVPAEPRGTLEEVGEQFKSDLDALASWMVEKG